MRVFIKEIYVYKWLIIEERQRLHGISVEKAISFNLINKGSKLLIEEFPSREDFIDTKEKIENI